MNNYYFDRISEGRTLEIKGLPGDHDEMPITINKTESVRKEGQFKPSKYFSDSQKQILMLSIFLAGRITQTWSGFAPILMAYPIATLSIIILRFGTTVSFMLTSA